MLLMNKMKLLVKVNFLQTSMQIIDISEFPNNLNLKRPRQLEGTQYTDCCDPKEHLDTHSVFAFFLFFSLGLPSQASSMLQWPEYSIKFNR